MIKSFFAALSFISRLPVPARLSQGLEIEQYQRSIVTFPLVGLLLGAIAGAVALLLQPWCGVRWRRFGVLALALLTPADSTLTGWLIPATAFLRPHPRSDAGDPCATAGWALHGGLALISRAGGESAGGWRAAACVISTPSQPWRRPAPIGRGMAVLLMYQSIAMRGKGGWAICLSAKLAWQQTLVTMAMAICAGHRPAGAAGGLRAAPDHPGADLGSWDGR